MSKATDLLKSLGGGGSYRGMVADVTPPGLDPVAAPAPPAGAGLTRRKDVWSIPLDRIEADPDQARTEFDEDALARLAESMKARGQLQPARVRKDEGRGVYVLLMGERRFRAARLAGLSELQCVVHEGDLDADDRLALSLIENALREDLKPVEQARAYRRLMDARGWSVSRLARELAVSQPTVSKALALLTLPEAIQERVEEGDLAPHTAYELSRLEDPEDQREVAEEVVAGNLTRTEAVEAVRRKSAASKGGGRAPRAKGKPAPPRPRTFRTAAGRVVVEPKRGAGADAVLEAVREVVRMLEAEMDGGAAEAA